MNEIELHAMVKNSFEREKRSQDREKRLIFFGLPLMWLAGALFGWGFRGMVGW